MPSGGATLLSTVIAGLVPAIHAGMERCARVELSRTPSRPEMLKQRPGVDARHKARHDGLGGGGLP